MAYTPMQLAEAFIQAGELPDALDALDQYHTVEPDDDDAWRLRADVLLRMTGDDSLQGALDALDRVSLATASDMILRSVILDRLDKSNDALAVIKDAHTQFHDDERLTERYLYMLRQRGQIDTAYAVVRKLPQEWRWLQWAGDLAVDAGDYRTAAIHYTDAIDNIHLRYKIDTAHPARAIFDDTATEAAAMTISGIYARLLLTRADAFTRIEAWSLADTDYTTAAVLLPDDPSVTFNHGLLAFRRGDVEMAVSLCKDALAACSETLREHLLTTLEDEPFHDLSARLNV